MLTPLAPKGPTHHPMVIIAALAVVLFCLAGTAAILGWIPSSISGNTAAGRGDTSAPERLASPLAPPVQPMQPMQQALLEDTPVAPPRAPDRAPVQLAAAAPAKPRCVHCGNVESVREITTRAQGSGVGAAGGAILGGLLGNQVGGGNGRQLATVAGAVGGAVVGNQVEGNMKASHSYAIRVRLDDGSRRTFHQQDAPGWRDGDRVRVVNGALRPVR
ncbi:MAG: glycine zipper 2TM domain-containing protein [Massilia sp.]|nr:glycine zipper 2TM domain-containing protein [Massilia sp.]